MSTTSDDLTSATPEPAGSPVFVDATGRRARRIERLAALIVLICMGYGLTLLIAALTGVPIQGAVVPYPDLGSHRPASTPAPPVIQPPALVNGALLPSSPPSPTPTASPTAGAAPSSGHPAVVTSPSTHRPSAHPTHTTQPTGRPTATPSQTHGRSGSAPGATHRPTTQPTAAHSHSPVVHP